MTVLTPASGERKHLDPIGHPENVESIAILLEACKYSDLKSPGKRFQINVHITRRNSTFVSIMSSKTFEFDVNQAPSDLALGEYRRLRNWIASSELSSKVAIDTFPPPISGATSKNAADLKWPASMIRRASIDMIDGGDVVRFVLQEHPVGRSPIEIKRSEVVARAMYLRRSQQCIDAVNALRLEASGLGFQIDRMPPADRWYHYTFKRRQSRERRSQDK